MREPPIATSRWVRDQVWPWVLTAGTVLALGWLVVVRGGSLGWDDADYLRDGLRVANLIRAHGTIRLTYPADVLLDIRPKPPLLVAWIAAGSWVSGLRQPLPLVVFASVVPFALLLACVVGISQNLFGRPSATFAVLAVIASPLTLLLGTKVMVETFMAVWVLLTFYLAARLVERPSARGAVGLGLVVGCALLTKLTVALLLPVPGLAFLVLFARRHGSRWATVGMVARVTGALLAIAGPWYVVNGRAAILFASFSSRYNIEALGLTDQTPRLLRIVELARELAGWPLLAAILVALAVATRRRARTQPEQRDAATTFVRLAVLGVGSGATILLYPTYFEPRFLLPIWPALAVALGPMLRDAATAARGRVAALLTIGLLGWGLVASGDRLAHDAPTATYWDARQVIDRLVADHGVATIYNVGNCRDWNVSKTGLINETRDRPEDCFVLHDLSSGTPAEIVHRLELADAVVAPDRSRLPANWFGPSPKLNRGYDGTLIYLSVSPDFRRIPLESSGKLPPLLIYVRTTKRNFGATPMGESQASAYEGPSRARR